MKKLILVSIIILLPAISLAKGVLEPPYKIEGIKAGIKKSQIGKPTSEGCKGFKMDEKELKSWLNKAVIISGMDWHDNYSWYPCYVNADLIKDGKKYKVKIWNGVTGLLTYPDGKSVFIADKSRRDKPE